MWNKPDDGNSKQVKKKQCSRGSPACASGKQPACHCGRHKRRGFDPWVRNIPGGGHGNPLQYSCLENPMDRRAWWATVHGVIKTEATQHAHMLTVAEGALVPLRIHLGW